MPQYLYLLEIIGGLRRFGRVDGPAVEVYGAGDDGVG